MIYDLYFPTRPASQAVSEQNKQSKASQRANSLMRIGQKAIVTVICVQEKVDEKKVKPREERRVNQ